MRYLFLLVFLLPVLSFGNTDTVQTIGNYQVHYSTLNTSFLSTKVAKAYGITRGKDKALLNVAILKKQAGGEYLPIKANVKVELNDLVHKRQLSVQEVVEEYAVYYLSPFDIDHKVTIYFTVAAQVEGRQTPIEVKFQRRLYKDGE